MNWILSIALFFAGIASGFWAAVFKTESNLFLALFFSTIATILFLICGFLRLNKKLWPGRNDWVIQSDYKGSEPIGKFEGSWISNDIQRNNYGIVVDIGKGRGQKPRVINRIQFIQDIKYRWAYPLKWRVTLTDGRQIIPEWDGIEQRESSFGSGIDIKLPKPQKIHSIAVTIVEPKPEGDNSPTRARYWAFTNLKLTEVRLFGRVCNVDIG